MNLIQGLPERVQRLLQSAIYTEYATLTSAGVPIDTPLLLFPSEDLGTLNMATGLAYPAKAERARRNPKVGLFIEGDHDEPVVAIAGIASVRDRDIQANTLRYISEVGIYGASLMQPWDIAREAIWYWSRIIVEVTPARILWWEKPSAMDRAPAVLAAPADTIYPTSDPAPAGATSPAPQWPALDWRELIQSFVQRQAKGYLTLSDADGFPLPMRVRTVELRDDALELDVSNSMLWQGDGIGCFTFEGAVTLTGPVTMVGPRKRLQVQRVLPALPIAIDPAQVFLPTPPIKAALMHRLRIELERRGQSCPQLPLEKPQPTAGAQRRRDRAFTARQPVGTRVTD